MQDITQISLQEGAGPCTGSGERIFCASKPQWHLLPSPGLCHRPRALTALTLPPFYCPQGDTRTPRPLPSPTGDGDAVGHFSGVLGQAAPHSCPVPGSAPQSHLEQGDKATQARTWVQQCPLAPGGSQVSPNIPGAAQCPPTPQGLPSVPPLPRDCPTPRNNPIQNFPCQPALP